MENWKLKYGKEIAITIGGVSFKGELFPPPPFYKNNEKVHGRAENAVCSNCGNKFYRRGYSVPNGTDNGREVSSVEAIHSSAYQDKFCSNCGKSFKGIRSFFEDGKHFEINDSGLADVVR